MSTVKGMLTREEAAARVGRSVRTIRSWQAHPERPLRTLLGLIPEGDLLEYDRRMRESVGRPRKVADPRARVLADVVAERTRQDAKWGEQNHPDGTGPITTPLFDRSTFLLDNLVAWNLAQEFTDRTNERARTGAVTWADILLEEVFEALAEDNPASLRAELVQIAAVAVQWVEAIDRRPEAGGSGS